MYDYGGYEAYPAHTGDLQSVLLSTNSWGAEEPRKTSHLHRNRLVILEVALRSHEHLGTSQHKKLSQ
jgi:hypothetical protein